MDGWRLYLRHRWTKRKVEKGVFLINNTVLLHDGLSGITLLLLKIRVIVKKSKRQKCQDYRIVQIHIRRHHESTSWRIG